MNCKNFFSTAYKVVMATGVAVELVKIVICLKNGGNFGYKVNHPIPFIYIGKD